MYQHLLAALDDSPLAAVTVDRAIALARSVNARITFFYSAPDALAAQGAAPESALLPARAGAPDTRGAMHATLAKALSAAQAGCVAADVSCVISDRPAHAIVEAAERLGCDLIFLTTRGPQNGFRGLFSTSVTRKVLQLTGITVLVSSLENDQPYAHATRAIGIIHDEHRSMAAVLRGLQKLARQARQEETGFDTALLRQMLLYLHHFPEKLHHPKEDRYLFRKLRASTSQFDDMLDELERQHAQEPDMLRALDRSLELFEAGDPAAPDAFTAALQQYSGALWEHMSLEETVILKGAREHLSEVDWEEIAAAFEANHDPYLGDDNDPTLRKMFVRIANAMGQASVANRSSVTH